MHRCIGVSATISVQNINDIIKTCGRRYATAAIHLTLTVISFAQTMRRLQPEINKLQYANDVSCLKMSVIPYALNADSGR